MVHIIQYLFLLEFFKTNIVEMTSLCLLQTILDLVHSLSEYFYAPFPPTPCLNNMFIHWLCVGVYALQAD